MKKIYIKNRIRQKQEYQFFRHQFVEACIKNGFTSKPDYIPTYRFYIRSICRRILYSLSKVFHKFAPCLLHRDNKKAILISATGNTMIDSIFPYYYGYEIVPFIWDVWPIYWDELYDNLRLFDCKTVFVTVKSFKEKLENDLGIRAFYIPEGIDTSIYHSGVNLEKRDGDVLEIGRQHTKYHEVILSCIKKGMIKNVNSSNIDAKGNLIDKQLQFPTHEELCNALPKYKIMICFPQCDTNPQKAGDLETLTQRYWEAMLSGCLIVGRAPQELIDLIGYDPVIGINWNDPEKQLEEIVNNIGRFQNIVNRNLESAKKYSSWDVRMPMIKKCLKEAGYRL